MKRVIKFLGVCLVVVYLLIAIGLTTCLLNYNDYNIAVIKDKTLLIMEDSTLEPDYKDGQLVVVEKNANDDIQVNDKIFFYNQYEGKVVVSVSTVTKTEKITSTETTYTIDNEYEISSEYVIGKTDTAKVYDNWGKVLGFLESRWGFLIIIILPISLLFIYEVYVIIMEIKNPKDKTSKKNKVEEKPIKKEIVEETEESEEE